MHVARETTARTAVASLGLAALVTLGLCAPPAARAQTVLTGHHDGVTTGNSTGYSGVNGAYAVPDDSGAVPSATFNDNGAFGLVTINSTLTVSGGQFDGNGSDGLYVLAGTAAITGGEFADNGSYGVLFTGSNHGPVSGTVSGGAFTNGLAGLDAENSAAITISGGRFSGASIGAITSYTGSDVVVTGGQFNGNTTDFYSSNSNTTQFPAGAIDIYGSFLVPGTNQTLAPGQTLSLTGVGSFTGTLANNSIAQSYTYDNYSAAITLHGVALAAPEPAQPAAFALGALSITALALRARKRITRPASARL